MCVLLPPLIIGTNTKESPFFKCINYTCCVHSNTATFVKRHLSFFFFLVTECCSEILAATGFVLLGLLSKCAWSLQSCFYSPNTQKTTQPDNLRWNATCQSFPPPTAPLLILAETGGPVYTKNLHCLSSCTCLLISLSLLLPKYKAVVLKNSALEKQSSN